MHELKRMLGKFGLSQKEASVYLSMLELGPSTVQEIAKKAEVNRATAYVLIESLKRFGLVSGVEQGKKALFAAESPKRFESLCLDEVHLLEEKKQELFASMPQLLALFNAMEEKPRVRFFEGEEGIDVCREAMLELAKGVQSWCQFIHIDQKTLEIAKRGEHSRLKFSSGRLSFRQLYSFDPGLELPVLGRNTERRLLPSSTPLFTGEFDIFDDFILLSGHLGKIVNVIVESTEVARMAKAMFELAWIAAKPPEKEKTLGSFLRAS